MKKIYRQLFILSLIILSAPYISAQGIDDAFGFPDTNVEDVPAAPIDIFVYIGVAAAACLGIRKVKN